MARKTGKVRKTTNLESAEPEPEKLTRDPSNMEASFSHQYFDL